MQNYETGMKMNEDEIRRKIGTHETERKKNADEIKRKIENIKERK